MKASNKNQLLDSLAEWGYPLMKLQAAGEPEPVLEDLLKQNEVRLLEGFPVVFLNALKEKKALKWESRQWNSARQFSPKSQARLAQFMSVSLLLFRLFGVEKKYQDRTYRLLLKTERGEETLALLESFFAQSEPVKMDGWELSTERLKTNFRNYVVHPGEEAGAQKRARELELELLLSELFTPRQKELLRKRLQGDPLKKTEREYYYRVVKKRLKALASEELHQMARSLLVK